LYISGCAEKGLFKRIALRREFVENDTAAGSKLANLGCCHAEQVCVMGVELTNGRGC
jgi:hypothetical protein